MDRIKILEAKLRQQGSMISGLRQNQRKQKFSPQPRVFAGEWAATVRDTGGTYTAGVDWNPQFDNLGITYRESRIPAAGGHLNIINNANNTAQRFRLLFESDSPWNPVMEVEINGGRIQVQDNGRIQERTTTGTLTLQCYTGLNVVEVMTNDTVNFARVMAPLIDHNISRWVSPDLSRKENLSFVSIGAFNLR